jgi:hypothetical protein
MSGDVADHTRYVGECLERKRLSSRYDDEARRGVLGSMNGTITWLHFGATARMCGVDLMGMAGRWGAFEQPSAQMPSELPETLSGFAVAQSATDDHELEVRTAG